MTEFIFAHKKIKEQTVNENGIQKLYRFDNGYGASIVCHKYSKGGTQGLWEVAVIEFEGENWDITYDTHITDDVLGHLSEADVNETLIRIECLEPLENNQPIKAKTLEEIVSILDNDIENGECETDAGMARGMQKVWLVDEIQEGFITDEVKAEKFNELIDLIYVWAIDNTWNIEHRLTFNEGIVELESISEDCCGDYILDFKNGELLLNEEEFGDSILHMLNYIESTL